MKNVICPECNGDGKETCANPDHGFIGAIGGELQRLGCPVCGHDENFKIYNKDGTQNKCEVCNGTGKVKMIIFGKRSKE